MRILKGRIIILFNRFIHYRFFLLFMEISELLNTTLNYLFDIDKKFRNFDLIFYRMKTNFKILIKYVLGKLKTYNR